MASIFRSTMTGFIGRRELPDGTKAQLAIAEQLQAANAIALAQDSELRSAAGISLSDLLGIIKTAIR